MWSRPSRTQNYDKTYDNRENSDCEAHRTSAEAPDMSSGLSEDIFLRLRTRRTFRLVCNIPDAFSPSLAMDTMHFEALQRKQLSTVGLSKKKSCVLQIKADNYTASRMIHENYYNFPAFPLPLPLPGLSARGVTKFPPSESESERGIAGEVTARHD